MAVQLLETWLLKEQAKIQQNYRELNQNPLKEPDILFIGDSIIEYYPLQELLLTDQYMVESGNQRLQDRPLKRESRCPYFWSSSG